MKILLDKYISLHYGEVRAYTLYFLSKMGSKIDVDTVINNSYLHVLTINETPTDINKVKSYLLNTIKCQVLWGTSQSHRDDRVTAAEYLGRESVDKDEISDKIQEDKTYNFNKSIIAICRKEIKDTVELIVYEAYIDKGYITARSMAAYFGITVTSAHYLIRDIKQNLRKIQYRYETIADI